jgi:hypothetical protein
MILHMCTACGDSTIVRILYKKLTLCIDCAIGIRHELSGNEDELNLHCKCERRFIIADIQRMSPLEDLESANPDEYFRGASMWIRCTQCGLRWEIMCSYACIFPIDVDEWNARKLS